MKWISIREIGPSSSPAYRFGRRCARLAAGVQLLVCLAAAPPLAAGGNQKDLPCVSAAEAAQHPTAEVCVSAHVYSIVELKDGTRFLDVCPLDLPDDQCRFFIMSLDEDRDEVGPLRKYVDAEVKIRGIIRPMHGRMGIVLSHIRQFSGGPEKFKPNPKLLRGFNGQTDRMPVRDPNLAPAGRQRSFMNSEDKESREALPGARRP